MSKPEAYLAYLSAGEMLALQSFLALVISLALAIALFWFLRRVDWIQHLVLPGLGLLIKAREIAEEMLGDISGPKPKRTLTDAEWFFVALTTIAWAIRGAATIIVVGIILYALFGALAPMMVKS